MRLCLASAVATLDFGLQLFIGKFVQAEATVQILVGIAGLDMLRLGGAIEERIQLRFR
jgi:hypothetical protein